MVSGSEKKGLLASDIGNHMDMTKNVETSHEIFLKIKITGTVKGKKWDIIAEPAFIDNFQKPFRAGRCQIESIDS